MKSSNSELCQVSVGGTGAPNHTTIASVNNSISMSYGDVLDGITIDGQQVGGQGGNNANLTLEEGEYWNSFKINSDPNYMGGIVTAVEFKTNKGRTLAINSDKLPTGSNPPTSAIVDNCFIYAIGLISGDFINQMTVYYISNFTPVD